MGFDGQPSHDKGIFLPNVPVDKKLVRFWSMFSDEYCFGIFHQVRWDPVADWYVMVGLILYILDRS